MALFVLSVSSNPGSNGSPEMEDGVRARRSITLAAIAILVAVLVTGCSDSNDDEATTDDGGAVTVAEGKTGTPVAVEVGENSDTDYFMNVDPTSVAAGTVTFTMKNTGTKEHEMVVLKTDTAADKLEVGANDRVSEADSIGEIGETEAGKSATATFDLEPGKYVLVCNIEKHYGKHMYSAFTVT
jgi:uncharacterized cupredoxin-like copper-binding protein